MCWCIYLYHNLILEHKLYFKQRVNHYFRTLEDAIDCCISSSHIPLITSNNFWNTYREQPMFDGGLFNLPDFVYGEYIKHEINSLNTFEN